MTDARSPPSGPERPSPTREERRAAALRENLRRRKAQARAREGAQEGERLTGQAPGPAPEEDRG